MWHFVVKAVIICLMMSSVELYDLAEETEKFWSDSTRRELDVALSVKKNTNVAKNVIIMIGDGLGVSTVTAGRIMKGQLQGQSGEEALLEFDKFPHAALIKTYAVDRQTSDSAATATAILSGVKTNYYTLGLTAAARLNNCASSKPEERSVDSVFVDAFNAGKATGVVTTTRINHATPAATYAHCAHRMWYGDADLPDEAKRLGCPDIAAQFVDQSHKFQVFLGGGRKYFQPNTTRDPEYSDKYNARLDGRDLVAEWKDRQTAANKKHEYVWNKKQFDAVDIDNTDSLLGMFEPKDMKYDAHRKQENSSAPQEPSLADMTGTAIKMLQKNDNGFFLLVEGGRIDHAHHESNAHLALHDTVAFDQAVMRALDLTSQSDTLVIVTADHSHVFTLGGYSKRGNPILGLAPSREDVELAKDGKAFTSLLYGNGPGFRGNTNENCDSRENVTATDTEHIDYLQQSAVPLDYETHGGEDVAIYAQGPMSHLFHGTHDQTYIARVMRYASCLDEDKEHCRGDSDVTNSRPDSAKSENADFTDFLGMSLGTTEAQVALYVQFVLLLILALFALLVSALFWKHMKVYSGKPPSEESFPLNEKI